MAGSPPVASLCQDIREALRCARPSCSCYSSKGPWHCPAHDDQHPSLNVTERPGEKPLIHCHAGCSQDAVIRALRDASLWTSATEDTWQIDRRPTSFKGEPITAWYDYHDASGEVLYIIGRTSSKQFPTFRPGGSGWLAGRGDVQPVLFNLHLLASRPNDEVVFVEGEKDAVNGLRAGLLTTTNPNGAGKARFVDLEPLRDRTVSIIPDRDEPGRKHVQDVTDRLRGIASTIKIVELPANAKDLSEYLEASPDPSVLAEILERTSPVAERAQTDAFANTRLRPGGVLLDESVAEGSILWGADESVLWMAGEPLMVYGPTGVGKTTIIQQLVLAAIEVRPAEFLGLTVTPRRRCLYLALDRPSQIKRSFRRMVSEADRALLDERLVIHDGPLDFDLAQEPERLYLLAQKVGADFVVIDSLKDAAAGLEKPEVGQLVNRAHQLLVSNGVELVINHHPRKSQVGNKNPVAIDDVFGARFIVDGCGSIVLLWGAPGDALIELIHLKQPRDSVGPWKLLHDHMAGTTERQKKPDAYAIIASSPKGITNTELTKRLLDASNPTDAQKENVRQKAKALIRKGLVVEVPGSGHGVVRSPSVFFATSNRPDEDAGGYQEPYQEALSEQPPSPKPRGSKRKNISDSHEGQEAYQEIPKAAQAPAYQESDPLFRGGTLGASREGAGAKEWRDRI